MRWVGGARWSGHSLSGDNVGREPASGPAAVQAAGVRLRREYWENIERVCVLGQGGGQKRRRA